MLAARNRVRTSAHFSTTVRSGARSGRRNVVLYALVTPATEPTRVGFIVSKAVGNAVTRNLVKRRLREVAAETIREHPCGWMLVARALPPAALADWSGLSTDYRHGVRNAMKRANSVAGIAGSTAAGKGKDG